MQTAKNASTSRERARCVGLPCWMVQKKNLKRCKKEPWTLSKHHINVGLDTEKFCAPLHLSKTGTHVDRRQASTAVPDKRMVKWRASLAGHGALNWHIAFHPMLQGLSEGKYKATHTLDMMGCMHCSCLHSCASNTHKASVTFVIDVAIHCSLRVRLLQTHAAHQFKAG